jgi:hypothetical protein
MVSAALAPAAKNRAAIKKAIEQAGLFFITNDL